MLERNAEKYETRTLPHEGVHAVCMQVVVVTETVLLSSDYWQRKYALVL